MAGPRLGGEKRLGRRASQHEEFEALGSFLLPCAVTRVSLLAVWCLLGATPPSQPWTPTVTLPQGRNGLRAWRMAVLSTFRALSLCRHVHGELPRSTVLDLTPIMSATVCYQISYVEIYSKFSTSGRSPNVIEAIRAARQIGARTVAFLGEQGELADLADMAIRIPSQSVPRIQEAHMFIGHLICEMAQRMTTGEYQTRFVPEAAHT